MTQLTCRSCGRNNLPNSRFCQYCGTPILLPQAGAKGSGNTHANQTGVQPIASPAAIPSIAEQEGIDQVNVPLSPGIRLRDRYVIQHQLGQGGCGRTYRAEDTGRFNESIVLKELTPTAPGTYALKKAEELFQREAATLHHLKHPQIPRFWEIFTDQKRLFLVQDFAEGPTYQQLLDTRQQQDQPLFSELEITQLFQTLLPVISYLHDQGVIHRDISPDNIIQRHPDGLPILIDLGSVKQVALDIATETAHQHRSAHPIQGTRIGKFGYAPKEQIRLGLVAPHSDLYALAVTALVLMTGYPPQQLQDPQSLEWHWPQSLNLSPNFATILNKMLASHAIDRYQSAAEILQELHTPIEPPTTTIMQPSSPSASGMPPIVPPPGSALPQTQSGGLSPLSAPVSSSTAPPLAAVDNTPQIHQWLWFLIGSLAVVILGGTVFFIFGRNNNTVDPKVSTSESNLSTPEGSLLTPTLSPPPIETPTPTPNRPFQAVEIKALKPYDHKTRVFTLLTPDGWQSRDNSQPSEVSVTWTDITHNGTLDANIFDVDYEPTQDEQIQLLQNFLSSKFGQEPDFYLNDPQPQKDGSILTVWGYQTATSENVQVKLLGHSFIESKGKRVAILSVIVPHEQFSELQQPINRIINNYKINTAANLP